MPARLSALDPIAERPSTSLIGWLHAAHGVYLIIAGLVLALFTWIIPTLLVKVIDSDVVDPTNVPPVARLVIDHRHLVPLAAVPVIAFGLAGVRKIPPAWLWVVLGSVSLLLPTLLLLYTFVVTIGLLYRYTPL